jgi:hypothetical protein
MFGRLAREQNRVGAIYRITLLTAGGRWRKRHGRPARLDSGTGASIPTGAPCRMAWTPRLMITSDDCPLGMLEWAATAKLTSSGKRRLKTLLYYRRGK